MLLREVPLAKVYLGAVADARGRIQEWVEIWLQSAEIAELLASGDDKRLSNYELDQRWAAECRLELENRPNAMIVTGMEAANPSPLLVRLPQDGGSPFATVERSGWELAQDGASLEASGLARYDTSIFRYLHQPQGTGPRTFLATSTDCPANAHVQAIDRLKTGEGLLTVFNAHAGLLRVMRFSPLQLEDYLQILEGRAWEGATPTAPRLFHDGLFAELQAWTGKPKGLPFLIHGAGTATDRTNEVFLLKLCALLGMFRSVRAYVAAQQTPLLNLSPSSFCVTLPEVGEQLPALWAARCVLTKTGQGYPLTIKSTQHKYFIRLGRTEPSVFLPEGLGAHSFGTGTIRKRDVREEVDGTVLEGTLVAEDYLGLDPHDLLWFKLPMAGQERLEFYAHVYKGDSVGPKEARFRTVPAKLENSVVAVLKTTGTFARAPYEIWPLLSSPCDLYSLGVLAVRVLLAHSQISLPPVVDDVLSLSRHVGKGLGNMESLPRRLNEVLDSDSRLMELVSPHRLVENGGAAAQARANIHLGLWVETIAWLLRLFPGAGPHSYCKDYGDVPPLALETVFEEPIQDLEQLVLRLRSVLMPTSAMNAEIAGVILEQIDAH